LGLGLIGLGMVADAHARSLRDLGDLVEVRGVYARDRVRREHFAARHGFAPAESLAALIADPRLDAVIVATPPNARLEIVTAAAAAGKAMLLEKPLERTAAAAQQLVDIAAAAGVPLGVVFQERLREGAVKLRELVTSGALGRVVAAQVLVPWWRPQSYYDAPGRGTLARDGGGVLITQAIHALDLMLHALGPVEEVQAIAATTALHRMETEDSVSGGLRFKNGALGTLWATTASCPGGHATIAHDFERASVRLVGGELAVSHHDGRREVLTAGHEGTGGGADPMAFPHAWHREVIRDFVLAVRDGRSPAITGTDAVAVQVLIEALLLSSREGRAVRVSEIAAALPRAR
jgi:predicted dehydrogenase